MHEVDAWGEPPLPLWRSAGEVLAFTEVELSVVERHEYVSHHPWADNWPTWPSL